MAVAVAVAVAVADYYRAVHVSVAALFTRLDFENTIPTYQRCLTTTNSTTFSTILLFQTLNGVLSLFLVFDDPVLTLPLWNQMRMRYAVSLHCLWILMRGMLLQLSNCPILTKYAVTVY